jgi:hypothetical protein
VGLSRRGAPAAIAGAPAPLFLRRMSDRPADLHDHLA